MIQLTQTLSPLVEQAQELTALVSEHLRTLANLVDSGAFHNTTTATTDSGPEISLQQKKTS